MLSRESGKPFSQSRFEVQFTWQLLQANVEWIRWQAGRLLPTEAQEGTAHDLAWETRVPLGTIAAILPFNFPLELLIEKAGPALAAGNAVVVKVPEETPFALMKVLDCFYEGGVPREVLAPVYGGREAGACLVSQPGLAAISLTGSTGAGVAVSSECASMLRKLHLELGGNDAAILLEDADLELAVPQLIFGRTLMNGQACASNKRLIVHASRVEELLERLTVAIAGIKLGDAADPDTQLGPLITEGAAARVISQLEKAVREGARVVCGDLKAKGCFVRPHLLAGVPATASIASDDEIFGPVLPVIPVQDENEALAVANQSRFGLSGCVFTADWKRGYRIARSLESGGCVVNGTGNYRPFTVPFGGVKDSGLGREGLGYTYEEMTRRHYIVFRNFKPGVS